MAPKINGPYKTVFLCIKGAFVCVMNEQINSVKKDTINNIKTVKGDYKKKTLSVKTPKNFDTISIYSHRRYPYFDVVVCVVK